MGCGEFQCCRTRKFTENYPELCYQTDEREHGIFFQNGLAKGV